MTSEEADPIGVAAYYLGVDKPREALDALRRGDPTDVRTYALRGRALLQLGQLGEAERQVREGLALEPENVPLLTLLAQGQTLTDAVAAEVTLRRALALDPDNPELLRTYVMILMEQGRYEWAERILDRAMAIAPEEMHAMRAHFLFRASSSGAAMEAAQEMVRRAPDDAAAHYLQGLALLRTGRAVAGLRHLREAAALRPADPVFASAARTLSAWYLWPVHVTGGVVHYILSAVFFGAGLVALVLTEELATFWTVSGAWFVFVAYKWAAVAGSMLLFKHRVARAMRDAVS